MRLIGCKNGQIIPIKNTICYRKGVDESKADEYARKYNTIGIVSSHNVYRKPNSSRIKLWCHCYKNPEKFLPKDKPAILLSESDFVDIKFLNAASRTNKFAWDFYYFTIGGPLGVEYKGLDAFIESLDVLCGKYKLKGIIVIYAHNKLPLHLNKRKRGILNKYRESGQIEIRNKQKYSGVAKIMASSRFGFFPNITDCSPLLLSESVARDCPVLVNDNILGGWKYVNDSTGRLFTSSNIDDSVNAMLNQNFAPSQWYRENYGYRNTATRFAKFCNENTKFLQGYSMIGFAGSEDKMRAFI